MKAVRVHEHGGPDRLALEDVVDPVVRAHEVLVEIRAAGVNPVDTYIRAGTHSVKPTLPYTPGFDGAGVVVGVGEQARRFAPGDRVYLAGSVTGTYAERALAAENQVHPLPAIASFAQGAAIGIPYATAYRALFQKVEVVAGETVLVHGASGGVGIAAVQLARAAGLTVIGTAGTETGRTLVRTQGAHHVLDHAASDFVDQCTRLTKGRGVDVILEMRADLNLGCDLLLLAKRGRVVVIGSRGTTELDPREAMVREATIGAMLLFNASTEELARAHAGLQVAIEGGTARPVIREQLRLAEVRLAHEMVLQPGAHGKVVLIP